MYYFFYFKKEKKEKRKGEVLEPVWWLPHTEDAAGSV